MDDGELEENAAEGEAEPEEAPAPPATGEIDALALAAFVFSLVSLAFPIVLTAVAVVLARLAFRRISAATDGRRGGQLASAAQVIALTWCVLVVAAVGTITLLAALIDDDDDEERVLVPTIRPGVELLDPLQQRVLDRRYSLPPVTAPPRPTTTVPGYVSYQGDARPSVGPLQFDRDARLVYSATGSTFVLTVVGDGGREVIASCESPCDGEVPMGRFRGASYELHIDTDAGWYLRVDGGREVAG